MMLHVKVATHDDAGLIASISRQTFLETFEKFNSKENMEKFMRDSFSIELLEAEVGAAHNHFFLAYEGGNIQGYARVREYNNPPSLNGVKALEISRLYAVKEAIGKGVGSFLMRYIINFAKQLGCDTVWLGVWESNQQALSFYHKWGFEKFDEHTFMLGDDPQLDWLMKRKVELLSNH